MRLGTVPCPVCGMTGQFYVQTQRIDATETGRELTLGLQLTCGCGTATADVTVAPTEEKPKPKATPAEIPGQLTIDDVDADGFDPADYTIPDVKAYVDAHPTEFEAVYDAEVAGRNRITLLDWMEAQQ